MKKKLEQIRNGKYNYKQPRLILSQERIHVKIAPGERTHEELYLGTENEERITGYVNTTNRRLIPSVEKFSGKAIQFAYGIDAVGMKPGEICNGELNLITNVGEYEIPFTIEAEKGQMQTSVGEVADLADFGNLAKNNYREAFRLFTNPAFPVLLRNEPSRMKALYDGLSENPVTYQHLEEFLIGIGQKDAVRVSLKSDGDAFYEVTRTIQETVTLQKVGWGHLRLEVETEGDFIRVQKKVISGEDFIGSVYHLEFMILADQLGRGREFGSIVIKSPYETLEYHVTASRNAKLPVQMSIFEKKRKVSLFQDFVSLKLHKLDFRTWVERAKGTLQEMRDAGCDYPIYQIYEAYVLHVNGQDKEANGILLRYQNKTFTKEDMELAGAYLYLCYETGLLSDRWDLVDRLHQMYLQRKERYLLLWILLQVDEEYKASPQRAAAALAHQFMLGCRSPLLYLQAVEQIRKDISLLGRMDEFWTQVMLFAAKEKLLTEEICMRISYLSGYEKRFSNSLLRTLTMAYEQFPSNDTLIAICKMMMKDNPGKKKYFPWFEKAVGQNLRLTRLYECYMDSIDERYQQLLPKAIRIYFAYNNSLSDRQKAFVYANVVRHRLEDEDVYENYRKIMREFALRKLQEGIINEDYAVLYQALSADIKTEEEREALRKTVFTHRLYCDDPKIRYVVVRHAQLREEEQYPCVKGVAYPRIYTEDAVLLFQDTQKRRYAATVDYNLRPLFDEEAVVRCAGSAGVDVGFLLHQCCRTGVCSPVSEENVKAYQNLLLCEACTDEFCDDIRRGLLDYYTKGFQGGEIDEYLRELDHKQFAKVDKCRLMELLIERGMLSEAYETLSEFGYEGVEVRMLLKLCSRMILQQEFEEDDELLCLANDVFRQELYDEVILRYLMLHYIGPAEEMLLLWKCAKGFQIDTYQLEERILTQLAFVEDTMPAGSEVLESYVCQKGQDQVILAYVTFLACEYFLHGQQMTGYSQRCLEAVYERDWDMDMMAKTALLKLHSKRKSWSGQQERQVRRLLEECGQRRLYFAFSVYCPGSCSHRISWMIK